MANIIYDMGQYRKQSNSTLYISSIQSKTENNSANENIQYCENSSVFSYQDVYIKLSNNNKIEYGQDYYLELDIPKNTQYNIVLNLKLCGATDGLIDTNKYQQIKQIIIPPMTLDSNLYEDILYYDKKTAKQYLIDNMGQNNIYINPQANSNYGNEEQLEISRIKDFPNEDWRTKTIANLDSQYVYKKTLSDSESNQLNTYYFFVDNSKLYTILDKAIYVLRQSWKSSAEQNENNLYHFTIAFSPKYNLDTGYEYLLLEIDRNSAENQTIQYVQNGRTYYGLYLNKNLIKYNLYQVNNLIGTRNTQIITTSGQLNHIGVWGHPEQTLMINGEEIKVGRSGFYELDDFEINRLGIIYDGNNFTIDYEYQYDTDVE